MAQFKKLPSALQDTSFQILFEDVDTSNLTPDEKRKYEENVKYYRDLKNMIDTAFEAGKAKGKEEVDPKRNIEIARQMKVEGEVIEKIVRYTGLTREEIEKL